MILLFLSQGQPQGVSCSSLTTANCIFLYSDIRQTRWLWDERESHMFGVAGSRLSSPAYPGPSPQMFSLPVHQQVGRVQQFLVRQQSLLPPPTLRVRRTVGGSGPGRHQGRLCPRVSPENTKTQFLRVCLVSQDWTSKTGENDHRTRETDHRPQNITWRIQTSRTVSHIPVFLVVKKNAS